MCASFFLTGFGYEYSSLSKNSRQTSLKLNRHDGSLSWWHKAKIRKFPSRILVYYNDIDLLTPRSFSGEIPVYETDYHLQADRNPRHHASKMRTCRQHICFHLAFRFLGQCFVSASKRRMRVVNYEKSKLHLNSSCGGAYRTRVSDALQSRNDDVDLWFTGETIAETVRCPESCDRAVN